MRATLPNLVRFATLLLILSTASVGRAQGRGGERSEPADSTSPAPRSGVLPRAELIQFSDAWRLDRSGRRLRMAGIPLFIAGLGLVAGGVAVFTTAPRAACSADGCLALPVPDGRDIQRAMGVVLAMAGVGAAATGVTLWSKGQSKINRADAMRLTLAPAPSGSSGSSLRLEF